jgi:hypothetical protein
LEDGWNELARMEDSKSEGHLPFTSDRAWCYLQTTSYPHRL